MPSQIELLNAARSIDERLSKVRRFNVDGVPVEIDLSKEAEKALENPVVTPSPAPAPEVTAPETPELVSVYKLTDGVRGERASKAGVTREEAQAWIEGREGEYEIE